MSVLGKCSREMSAIHLIKTLPCCMAVKCGHCRIAVLTELVLHGTTVLYVFLGVVGERMSKLFGGTFVILFCQYVYFTFCFYVFDMSSVVFYSTVLL